MACAKPGDCAPCNKCPETPAPVMPRCDVVLPDGSYTNATVVIEGGCITGVIAGSFPLYQPDSGCAGGGGGGGGDGLEGDQGPPGLNATINVVNPISLAPGAAPTVTNLGTDTNAVLQFGIPRGQPGAAANWPPGTANSTAADLVVTNGLLMSPLPLLWPPVFEVMIPIPAGAGISFSATKDPATGIVNLSLDMTSFIAGQQAQLDAMGTQNATLITDILDLQTRVYALENP